MLRVGLTGGIGSGKTIVANVFKMLGVPVFDADSIAKNIMNEDENLKQQVMAIFGEQAYTQNILNRKHIADIVFSDALKLQQLNALVHPATIAAAERWFAQQTAPYVIKEAALLFEAGSAAGLHYVIGVHAPTDMRIQRVIQRDNVTREEVLLRMNRQIDEAVKMRLYNFIIVNDEDQLVLPQVIALHEKLLSLTPGK